MKIRCGRAPTIEEAVKHGPTSEIVEGTARLAVDGAHSCYVRETTDKIVFNPDGKTGTMWLIPAAIIRGPTRHLDYTTIGSAARVSAEHPGIDETTWNEAGAMIPGDLGNFARYLLSVIPAGEASLASLTSEGETFYEGRPVLSLTSKLGNGMTSEYLIDETRGFIPLRARHYLPDKELYTALITDIQECPGGRWFPTRCVVFSYSQTTAAGSRVKEIVVADLDVIHEPSKADLSFWLPAGTFVNDGDSPHSQFGLKEAMLVTPDNIEELAGRTARVKARNLAEDSPTTYRSNHYLLALIATANVVCVGLGAFYWFRRRRAQA